MTPSYLRLHESGELTRRAEAAVERLAFCRLCPRECAVDRLSGETGYCGTGRLSVVASFQPHFGEESPLVGEHGSGTIFFAGCNLGCRFCQNHDISRDPDAGLVAQPDELAGVMLDLKGRGCRNINLVTPSHVVPQILEALPIAVEHGLDLPLVYNTGGYDSLETLRLLDGVVDIYMPDIKIWDADLAQTFLGAADYPARARAALIEMHRQVGDLEVDEEGNALRGLLVRHLVMPDGVAGTGEWMIFLSGLSSDTYLNIMDQYRPCAEAGTMPPIHRAVVPREVREAVALAHENGLHRLDGQGGRRVFRLYETR